MMTEEDLVILEEEGTPEVAPAQHASPCGFHHCRTFVKTVKIPIEKIKGGATLVKCVPLSRLLGGECRAVGVVGYSVVSTSRLSVFRIRVCTGMLVIGVRNDSNMDISGKYMEIDLLVR